MHDKLHDRDWKHLAFGNFRYNLGIKVVSFMNQNGSSVFEFCLLFDYHVKIQEKIKMLWKLKIQEKQKVGRNRKV